MTYSDEKRASEYLLSVHARMPDFLRPLLYLLVLFFYASPLQRRELFSSIAARAARLMELANWRRSRIEFRRRFAEFYGSLGVFGLYPDHLRALPPFKYQ
ncbi:UNVERIFIED_ORG: hypothetical protein J2W85_001115 [Ensifer adhaerens]|nr:hypothetical protein [Ensifer adhaerens]